MGYSHSFYAVDVSEVKALIGSKDNGLLEDIIKSQAEDIEYNDECFEDEIEDGDFPDTTTALREIFDGNPRISAEGAMYGYALQVICRHMGQPVEGGEYGVANMADHPYESLLVKSG